MGMIAFCVVNCLILPAFKRGGYVEKPTNKQKNQSKLRK